MRIDLNCPFAEKDQAKLLGARWDANKRVWYIVDVEDLTPFMKWIRSAAPEEKRITLAEYQQERYAGTCHALSYAAAKAFGIPYPLQAGWFQQYKNRTASVAALDKPSKKSKAKHKPRKDHHAPVTTGKLVPLCNCDVPPWEDCEHTEELSARAMAEMLT